MRRVSLRRMNYGSNYERERVNDFHKFKPLLMMSPLYPFLGIILILNPHITLLMIAIFVAYKIVNPKVKEK